MNGLDLYNETAQASAVVVIRRYSTSFNWASRLFDPPAREHIARIYALVRLADELVDGPAETAGLDTRMRQTLLDELEAETGRALRIGFSANLVVHAFALTAREHGFGTDLSAPFFASMRRDLGEGTWDAAALDEYIHGSAEVVGLMCLAVFESRRIRGGAPSRSDEENRVLQEGARRLGAAFQKVNFLRDYAADRGELGRTYFAETADGLTEEVKRRIVVSIRADLRAADRAVPLLDRAARASVWAAQAMFRELTDRIDATPAEVLAVTRVRVPDPVKAGILVRALAMKASR